MKNKIEIEKIAKEIMDVIVKNDLTITDAKNVWRWVDSYFDDIKVQLPSC